MLDSAVSVSFDWETVEDAAAEAGRTDPAAVARCGGSLPDRNAISTAATMRNDRVPVSQASCFRVRPVKPYFCVPGFESAPLAVDIARARRASRTARWFRFSTRRAAALKRT